MCCHAESRVCALAKVMGFIVVPVSLYIYVPPLGVRLIEEDDEENKRISIKQCFNHFHDGYKYQKHSNSSYKWF